MRTPGPNPPERVPLESIDLYDLATYRDSSQHPAWAALRKEAPLWRQDSPVGIPFWSVTRYADVAAVLRDTKRFGSEHGTILAVQRGDPAGGKTINLMDPPKHTWVRVPAMRTMSTLILQQRTERIRQHVREVAAPFFESGECDFADLMLHLPMTAVGEIIGLPRSLWRQIPHWTVAGVAPEDPHFAVGTAEETLNRVHYELFAMFNELIRARRARPADDLISLLLTLDFGGRRLTEHEVLLNCYSMVMGANTTTPETANHLLLALVEQPDAWRTLKRNPALVSSVVEEGLRWASPTNHLMRRLREEVEIHGTRIPEGSLLCAWVGSANRDERVFRDPYRFDPARFPNPHMAFGLGPHYCIGGPAARVAIRLLMEDVVAQVDSVELAGEVIHLYSNFINGITRMPVRVRLASRGHPPLAAAGTGRQA
jgi:cytochrome P450